MHAEHGEAPKIEVVGDPSHTFTFVPSHFRFVAHTLLKNSSVATLRRHHHSRGPAPLRPVHHLDEATDLPPVKVIVAVTGEAVQLKLADEAGGIRRSSLMNVWSYRALESKWWKPADGLSLPLARLYCHYFGGEMSLVPMEGYGTDCWVTFNRLAHANSEQILALHREDLHGGDSGGDGVGLFDAQSRRAPGGGCL